MKSFSMKTSIVVERNLSAAISSILEIERSEAIIIFADEHVVSHPQVVRMAETISKGRKVELCKLEAGEPTVQLVNEYSKKFADFGADMLVAIGGGSVIDFTKALSGMLVYHGDVGEFQMKAIPYEKAVKKIAVPTTAGTGSEASRYGVLINRETGIKRGVIGPCVVPDYAVVCAELGMSVPAKVTVSCGMDAIAHAVESYVSKMASEVSKMYSKEAFVRLYRALPKVLDNLNDEDMREEMLLGSLLAGAAISNANTGMSHCTAYAPGVYFYVPHGVAVASVFAEGQLINIEKGYFKGYAELYRMIADTYSGDDREDAARFVDVMREFSPLKRYPQKLSDFGVTKNDIEFLAEKATDNIPAFAVTNPAEITKEDCYRMLNSAL